MSESPKFTTPKVRFGEELIDLSKTEDPISLETFQVLLEEDYEKPYFAFCFVHSSSSPPPPPKDNSNDNDYSYKHLYSAKNIVHWYPLRGTTDPCTGKEIEKLEYYFYVKGQPHAIHMGDHYRSCSLSQKEKKDDATRIDSAFTKDLLIWTFTAEDEPSRMMSLLGIAYLYYFGLCRNIKLNDELNTSDILCSIMSSDFYKSHHHHHHHHHQQQQQQQQQVQDVHHHTQAKQEKNRHDYSAIIIPNRIYTYIVNHISQQIQRKQLECSDIDALLTSMKCDAVKFIAEKLIELDPNIDEDDEDFSKLPHIRTNALIMTMHEKCTFTLDGLPPSTTLF